MTRDDRRRVIYVGKAVSIRKRVVSHFAKAQVPSSPGHAEMVASVAHVECVVVASESEALLSEQGFIKQYRPSCSADQAIGRHNKRAWTVVAVVRHRRVPSNSPARVALRQTDRARPEADRPERAPRRRERVAQCQAAPRFIGRWRDRNGAAAVSLAEQWSILKSCKSSSRNQSGRWPSSGSAG